MLLTYSDVGKISGRRYEFFEDAFSALWSKHDARKRYERRRSTDLDKTQFVRLLSGFSLSTYSKELLQLSEKDIIENINVAKRITGIDVKPQDFMDDLIESVCLLVRDGPVFKFVHRTFEEYFAAMYVGSLDRDKLDRVINLLVSRIDEDNVLYLLFSMAQRNLERDWVYPNLKLIYGKFEECDDLMRMYSSLDAAELSFLQVLRALYEINPGTGEVLAALDAGSTFGLRAYALKALRILETDLSNLKRIYEDVDGKQRREESELLNVLDDFGAT